jgi:hypothetical protein
VPTAVPTAVQAAVQAAEGPRPAAAAVARPAREASGAAGLGDTPPSGAAVGTPAAGAATGAAAAAGAAGRDAAAAAEGIGGIPATGPAHGVPAAATDETPPPTLEEAVALAPGADVSRFVRPGVDAAVQRTALKRLFADPHFNIMDGLDVYIDDYGKPDPIPESMLRQLNQSRFLGLFDAPDPAQTAQAAADPAAVPATAQDAGAADPAPVPPASHEDPDLQLQPDGAAGRPGAEDRARTGGA